MASPLLQIPIASVGAVAKPAAVAPLVSPAATTAKGASFASTLESALQSVSGAQNTAATMQRQYQAGVAGVSLEQTMVAMQKAQVGFQAALAVRNRMVSAYADIMNMQV